MLFFYINLASHYLENSVDFIVSFVSASILTSNLSFCSPDLADTN